MNVSIVPLAEAHFEPLRNVVGSVAEEKRFLALTRTPSREEAQAFYRNILDNDLCQFVALIDGEVVGWCDILPTFGQARSHVGILGVGLLPQARRRGIGKRLMEATIAKAWAKGLTRIELTVRVDNPDATALYERLGFRHEGTRTQEFRIDGRYYDGYAMALLRDEANFGSRSPIPPEPRSGATREDAMANATAQDPGPRAVGRATTTFHGVRYLVADVQRAIDFYTQRLGFTLGHRHLPAFATVALGPLELHLSGPEASGSRLLPGGEPQRAGGSNRVVLRVSDLPGVIATLREAGVVFRNAMETGPAGAQVQVLDPDGNPIELFEPAKRS